MPFQLVERAQDGQSRRRELRELMVKLGPPGQLAGRDDDGGWGHEYSKPKTKRRIRIRRFG